MGYGGVFKTVVRVAVPVTVGLLGGGPLAVALSSAASTGATGGSFKESLTAAATSYVGASIGQSVSSAANAGAIDAMPTTFIDSSGVTQVAAGGTIPAGFSGAGSTLSGTTTGATGLTANLNTLANNANNAVTDGVSQFTDNVDLGFGGIQEGAQTTFRNAGDVLDKIGMNTIGEPLGAEMVNQVPSTVLGSVAGGAATITLEQGLAYGNKLAEQELLDQGYSPQQIAYLAQEARNRLAAGTFEDVTTTLDNPFIRTGQSEEQRAAAEAEFKKVIASGIEKRNTDLGANVTQNQWSSVFDSPNLGQNILNEEQDLRRGAYSQEVGNLFTGEAFKPLDNTDVISSIVNEQAEPAFNQIANVEARGNLNVLGGKTAREYITSESSKAEDRVGSLTDQLLSERQRDISDIGTQAIQAAQNYTLGDEPFSIDPYKEQRQGIISETTNTLGNNVRDLLGNEQLFNVRGALNTAGTNQGLVSGAPSNPSLLDTLAARASTRRNDRGLGTRGSGVF